MDRDKLYSLEPLGEGKRVEVVRIADIKVSADPKTTLVTYALGSCIAVTLYDPQKMVGGMLHFLLPEQPEISSGQQKSPLAYADTGFENLLKKVLQLGVLKQNLIVKAVGGAQLLGQTNIMDVGQDNFQSLLKVLKQHDMSLTAEDVGGDYSRTAMLEIDSGNVTIRAQKKVFQI